MALIMCNMAMVQKGDFVIDPFVGTGSVLVPCATFGGICMGTDIDMRVLHGNNNYNSNKEKGSKGKCPSHHDHDPHPSVVSNFIQYELPIPDLIRADNSRSPLRCLEIFDAIICDPPYGIRAGARKCGRYVVSTSIPSLCFISSNHGPITSCYNLCTVVVISLLTLRFNYVS